MTARQTDIEILGRESDRATQVIIEIEKFAVDESLEKGGSEKEVHPRRS